MLENAHMNLFNSLHKKVMKIAVSMRILVASAMLLQHSIHSIRAQILGHQLLAMRTDAQDMKIVTRRFHIAV